MKALYPDVHEYGGSVSAPEAYSDVGQPMKVTYTAPDHKPSSTTTQPGFLVAATSRAGVAEAVWKVGLGANWSGSIVCRTEYKGDQGQNDLQTWSNYRVMQNSVTVSDGQAMAVGSGSQKNVAETQQNALIGGVHTKIRNSSEDSSGTVVGYSSVPLSVASTRIRGTIRSGRAWQPRMEW